MISKIQAIQSLVPGAEVSVAAHDGAVTWINPEYPLVTDKQIAAEQERLQMLHDWHEYRRNRAAEYPTIQEQLDALYHAGVFPSEMAARIRAVKEKYPAPTMTPEQLFEFNQQQQQIAVATPVLDSVAEQSVEPIKPTVSTTPMTREEWLEMQAKIESPKAEPVATVPKTMTREEWLEWQKSL
jgi:hypothetical protein